MNKALKKYIPAMRFHWLNRLFDPFIRLTMPDFAIKRRVIQQARLEAQHRVLDVGCGTGTLLLLIKKSQPEVELTGLDGDPNILEIAKKKVGDSGFGISFDHGLATEMPYQEDSFDRVFSTLVFHHLPRNEKIKAIKESYRVLKPGGEIHIADFGRPHNALMFLISLLAKRFEETVENIQGLLPVFLGEAGFEQVEVNEEYGTIFGTIALVSAVKPQH